MKNLIIFSLLLCISLIGYNNYTKGILIEDLTSANKDLAGNIRVANTEQLRVTRVSKEIQSRSRVSIAWANYLAKIYIRAGEKYGIDPLLTVRIGDAESNYNPRAVSHMGARGIQQIMWKYWGGNNVPYVKTAKDLFDPERNIFYSTYIIARFKKECGGTYGAVTCYNGGKRALKHPKAETISYRAKVLKGYHEPIIQHQRDVLKGYEGYQV